MAEVLVCKQGDMAEGGVRIVRADKVVAYGELMNVMNLLRAAGFLKAALVGLDKSP